MIQDLIKQTLFEPREAAARLLALPYQTPILWTALALMCVLNAIVFSITLTLVPPDTQAEAALIPSAFYSPIMFAIMLFGGLVITVFILTWIGQFMGGKGQMRDLLILLTWLQGLRLLLQVFLLLLSLSIPMLAGIVVLASLVWGVIIITSFIDRAHQFDNIMRAVAVLVLSVAGLLVALSILLIMLGVGQGV